MKKFFFLGISVLLILCVFSVDAEARRKKKSKLKITVNQILKLDGTLTRNGQPALEFSGVKDGDLLETGERSAAVIRVPGLGLFRMGSKTKFRMTKFQGRDLTRLELSGGTLVALFPRLGDHEVILPHGLLIPQGASFIVDAEEKDFDELGLCSGKFKVKAFQPETEAVAKATPSPTSSPENELLKEISVNLESASQQIQLLDKGLIVRKPDEGKKCDSRLMADLESLYGLP